MFKLAYTLYLALALFLFFPHSGKAALPWPTDAGTLGTGGNMIDYDINPGSGISLCYVMPYQLKELSVKRLKADVPFKGTVLSGGLGQSGDEVFQETLLSLGAGKMLSEKIYLSVTCSFYHLNTINGVNGNTILAEILCLYKPDSHIMFGSYLFNPTGSAIRNKARDYKLNQSFHIGCSVFPEKNLALIFEYGKIPGESSRWHFGTEYMLIKALSLRLGFSGAPFMTSWGIGWKFKKTDISVGAGFHPVLGLTSGISIKYFWERKK